MTALSPGRSAMSVSSSLRLDLCRPPPECSWSPRLGQCTLQLLWRGGPSTKVPSLLVSWIYLATLTAGAVTPSPQPKRTIFPDRGRLFFGEESNSAQFQGILQGSHHHSPNEDCERERSEWGLRPRMRPRSQEWETLLPMPLEVGKWPRGPVGKAED